MRSKRTATGTFILTQSIEGNLHVQCHQKTAEENEETQE